MGLFHSLWSGYENPYPIVCDLVSEKIYLDSQKVSDWKHVCLHRASLVYPWSNSKLIIQDIRNVLQLLNVSHLALYEPVEVQKIWSGIQSETGIESEFVDGELVVMHVHPDSAAQKSGIRFGDIITKINNEYSNPDLARSSKGQFEIQRKDKILNFKIDPVEFRTHDEIQVSVLNREAVLVRVPTFLKEYYSVEQLNILHSKIRNYKKVVLDFRGNAGGNFVAGMRLLGVLNCDASAVGVLKSINSDSQKKQMLANDPENIEQFEALKQGVEIELHPFVEKCMPQKTKYSILIDSKTASMAELVAQALKEKTGARLLGGPSAGKMLLGMWYDLPELGSGVRISIPEASFVSALGHTIEAHGVQLDQILYYDLRDFMQGKDTWIQKILSEKLD